MLTILKDTSVFDLGIGIFFWVRVEKFHGAVGEDGLADIFFGAGENCEHGIGVVVDICLSSYFFK